MADINIGPASDFDDPGRKLIESGGVEVGVFKLGGEFFAWLNVCPHAGGPACQGKIIAKVEELVGQDRKSLGLGFSKTQLNVTCPWHGYEFDIRTGRHQSYGRVRLVSVKVRVEEGDVIVTMPSEKVAAAALGASAETRQPQA